VCYSKSGVSELSKAYPMIYGDFVAQREMRNALIVLEKSALGKLHFEPGAQGFESLRAHFFKKVLGGPATGSEKQIESMTDAGQERRGGYDFGCAYCGGAVCPTDGRRRELRYVANRV
jgi:hypothetical protein